MKGQVCASRDFTPQMLPATRAQAFKDIISVRFRTLVSAGLITLLSMLPLLAVMFIGDLRAASVSAFSLSGASAEETRAMSYTVSNQNNLMMIPAYIIFAAGNAGTIKIIRRLCCYEPLFFKDDFFSGVKSNINITLPLYLSGGIIIFLNGFIASSGVLPAAISGLPYALSFILLFPASIFALAQAPVYKVHFFRAFTNGMLFYFRTAPASLGIALLHLPVFFVPLIPYMWLRYLIYVLFAVLIYPVLLLGRQLYALNCFDRYVNRDQYPDLYRKGLFGQDVAQESGTLGK